MGAKLLPGRPEVVGKRQEFGRDSAGSTPSFGDPSYRPYGFSSECNWVLTGSCSAPVPAEWESFIARDTQLARSVAIKVLPAEVAADARQRARLEQEARSISALNHPHICALHDVGREADLDYLVLEFYEGQTLAARLDRGALPLAQVCDTKWRSPAL